MRRDITRVIGCFFVSAVLISCNKDFFNQVPDDRMTIDEVYQRQLESERYLANIYNYLRDESDQTLHGLNGGVPWMGISDEGDITYTNQPSYVMNLGNWNAGSTYYEFWEDYYAGIRAATYFIQRIGENTELQLTPEGQALIVRYRAEARALRAEFYAAILKQYGPAIILPPDEVVSPQTSFDEFSYPRSSYDECVDFITAEFDEATKDLPLWYESDLDYGRMNGAVCMAYKARLLIYAASPLWNGNERFSGFVNKDGKQLVNQQYSAEKWERAANAAKAVIDLNRFSLFKQNDAQGNLDPFLSYQNVLLDEWNQEIIFARKVNTLGTTWEWRSTPRFAGGASGNGVTQVMVDAYQMQNGEVPILGYNPDGTPIINSESGYVESGFHPTVTQYTDANTWNMYVGREPRFYASVYYNGSYLVNRNMFPDKIGMFFYGNSGRNGAGNNFSRTGYLVRKGIHPNSNQRTGVRVARPLVLIRLAEVYLSYAEALNEYDPGNTDILRYINLIRERAGIPALPHGMSQADMRERIRLERRIELAFERHRWFDSHRWLTAEHTDGGQFYGMNIDEGESFEDESFYERVVFENRVFETPRYYLFPIPQHEMDRNVNLVQNPGW